MTSRSLDTIYEHPETRCAACQLCTKGTIKVVGGIVACPIICPISCLAGTAYCGYQLCKEGGGPCYEAEIQDRNSICMGYGILTSMHMSGLLMFDGSKDIKRSIHALQEMSR